LSEILASSLNFTASLNNSIDLSKIYLYPDIHALKIIAHEFGVLGMIIILLSITGFFFTCFTLSKIKNSNNNKFELIFCRSIAVWLFILTTINFAINLHYLNPKILITLPMINHGHSDIIVFCIILGVLYQIKSSMNLEPKLTSRTL
jgi:cell division protein FtsW